MLDVCELIMVKEVINSLELIIEKKVRVGTSPFFPFSYGYPYPFFSRSKKWIQINGSQ